MANPKRPGRRSHRISFVFDEETEKGFETENRVEERLRALREAGLIFHYERAEPEGELNNRYKADFMIWPEFDDHMIPLQVKSSEFGKMMHLAGYGVSHLVRACVVAEPSDTDPMLDEKILRELGLYTKTFEEFVEAVAGSP